ncbi:keratin-associated protein 10-9-like [Esox lucius]|uniref:keratin-associated protein 10-9-like n=1 Tax=Esox lucius TaxID=8010 RepID=UPI0014773D27|nr:keratin-associated protein 10-9-like [Esox lucius]
MTRPCRIVDPHLNLPDDHHQLVYRPPARPLLLCLLPACTSAASPCTDLLPAHYSSAYYLPVPPPPVCVPTSCPPTTPLPTTCLCLRRLSVYQPPARPLLLCLLPACASAACLCTNLLPAHYSSAYYLPVPPPPVCVPTSCPPTTPLPTTCLCLRRLSVYQPPARPLLLCLLPACASATSPCTEPSACPRLPCTNSCPRTFPSHIKLIFALHSSGLAFGFLSVLTGMYGFVIPQGLNLSLVISLMPFRILLGKNILNTQLIFRGTHMGFYFNSNIRCSEKMFAPS